MVKEEWRQFESLGVNPNVYYNDRWSLTQNNILYWKTKIISKCVQNTSELFISIVSLFLTKTQNKGYMYVSLGNTISAFL